MKERFKVKVTRIFPNGNVEIKYINNASNKMIKHLRENTLVELMFDCDKIIEVKPMPHKTHKPMCSELIEELIECELIENAIKFRNSAPRITDKWDLSSREKNAITLEMYKLWR